MAEARVLEDLIAARVYCDPSHVDLSGVEPQRLPVIMTCANWWSQTVLNSGQYEIVPCTNPMSTLLRCSKPEWQESVTESMTESMTESVTEPMTSDAIETMVDTLTEWQEVDQTQEHYLIFEVSHRAPRYTNIQQHQSRIHWLDTDFTKMNMRRGISFVHQHRLQRLVIRPNTLMTWNDHRLYEDERGLEHMFPQEWMCLEIIQIEIAIFEAYRSCGYPEDLMMHSFHHPKRPEKMFVPKHMFRWFGPSIQETKQIFVCCLLTEDLFRFDLTSKCCHMMRPKSHKAKRTLSTFSTCWL
jgi:hypothetical protein